MRAQPLAVGPHAVQRIKGDFVDLETAREFEDIVNEAVTPAVGWKQLGITPHPLQQFQIPSMVVRAEFLSSIPHRDDLVDLELSASGMGIAEELGVPLARELAHGLRQSCIRDLGLYRPETRERDDWQLNLILERFQEAGINAQTVPSLKELPSDASSWIHAATVDVIQGVIEERAHREGKLPKHVHSALERTIIGPTDDARCHLVGFNATALDIVSSTGELDQRYPNGYVVRHASKKSAPIRCVGDEGSTLLQQERWNEARRKVQLILNSAHACDYYAQALRDVDTIRVNDHTYREHRVLFFIYDRDQKRYRLGGGYGLATRQCAVQLKDGAVLRPVRVH